LLTGAGKIAVFIGKPPRTTYHLLEGEKLPAFKLGKIWHARKSTLRRHIEALEAKTGEEALRWEWTYTAGARPR
jgi:hypothetical protein